MSICVIDRCHYMHTITLLCKHELHIYMSIISHFTNVTGRYPITLYHYVHLVQFSVIMPLGGILHYTVSLTL